MNNSTRIRLSLLAAALCLCAAAHAAPVSFTGSYSQNFDSLGVAGTTMPVGFSARGIAGGNNTYVAATPISATGIASATNNTATLGLWTPGNAGYSGVSRIANAGWWTNVNDRALATGPTGNAATVIELSMTNNTGGPLLGVVFSYDFKVMTNGNLGTEASELPGYAFFYNFTGGTNAADWTKVSALSLTNSTAGTITNSSNIGITFATAVTNGGLFHFRWADDNNVANSPDQTFGVDNINITAVSVGITAPSPGTYVQTSQMEITAVASVTGGTVTNVEFFVDGAKIGEDFSSPYSLDWISPAVGAHSLTVVATDATGATNLSSPVAISIIAGPATTITRGVYLQFSTPTSIVIRWRTALATDSRVVFGSSLGALNTTNYNGLAVTDHIVTLTNLTPDSRYYYAISSTGGPSAGATTNHFFLTHPLSGTPKPVRIWVLGDAGLGSVAQTQVRDAFYAWNGTNTVHAWLQLGDNAYNSGTDAEYQTGFYNIYPNTLRNSVMWSTLGNHDANNGDTSPLTDHPYFQMFNFPTAGEAGGVASGTEHYYSFDLGMIHFVCLDSQAADRATNAAMAIWLRLDLAANTNRWLIAFWHHPPYSKGSHDSDSEAALVEMRANFNPIMEAAGVDLVLCGHSHSYERSYFLDGHYGASGTFNAGTHVVQTGNGRELNGTNAYLKPEHFTSPPHTPIGRRGAVYAVPGSSGQISGGTLNHPAHIVSLNVLGSVVLDITTSRLDAVFLREQGAGVISNDWFTIRKENYAPVATNKTVTIAADASTNLVVTGSDVNRNPITFATNSLPTNGLIANFNPANGTFTYTPVHGSTNSDKLNFVANDGQTNSATAQLTINITPLPDANTNGIPDAWETQYGTGTADADDDTDGASNLHEYRAGTNPTNALSWLHFTQIAGAGAGYQVVWSSVGGSRYRLQFSNGDANGSFNGVFTSVPRTVGEEMDSNPVGTAGTMSFTDDFTLTGGAPVSGARYYRVEVIR